MKPESIRSKTPYKASNKTGSWIVAGWEVPKDKRPSPLSKLTGCRSTNSLQIWDINLQRGSTFKSHTLNRLTHGWSLAVGHAYRREEVKRTMSSLWTSLFHWKSPLLQFLDRLFLPFWTDLFPFQSACWTPLTPTFHSLTSGQNLCQSTPHTAPLDSKFVTNSPPLENSSLITAGCCGFLCFTDS